jgi:hypothetical protein
MNIPSLSSLRIPYSSGGITTATHKIYVFSETFFHLGFLTPKDPLSSGYRFTDWSLRMKGVPHQGQREIQNEKNIHKTITETLKPLQMESARVAEKGVPGSNHGRVLPVVSAEKGLFV